MPSTNPKKAAKSALAAPIAATVVNVKTPNCNQFGVFLYGFIKIFSQGFRGFFSAVIYPPAEGLHKGGADVVYPKAFRQVLAFFGF